MRMRKILAAAAVMLLCAAPLWAFPREPVGFNGISWGTYWDTVKSQFRQSSRPPEGRNYYYERRSEYPSWKDLRLNRIDYIFREDERFWGIDAFCDDNSSHYRTACERAAFDWGEPTDRRIVDGYRESRWEGYRVTVSIRQTSRGWVLKYRWRGHTPPPPRHYRPVPPPPPPPHHYRPVPPPPPPPPRHYRPVPPPPPRRYGPPPPPPPRRY